MALPAVNANPYGQSTVKPLASQVLAEPQPVPVSNDAPALLTPSPHGFVQLAATMSLPRFPLLAKLSGTSDEFRLSQAKAKAKQLEGQGGVEKAAVYRKTFIPGGSAPFNVVVLLETDSVESANALEANAGFQSLSDVMTVGGQKPDKIVASNIRRMGDVDRDTPGLFIFNYFKSAKPQSDVVLVWEKEAKAYQDDAGLDNSLLLAPVAGNLSGFSLVNHARWNGGGLFHMVWAHMTKPRLRKVKSDEAMSGVVSQPTVYRLA